VASNSVPHSNSIVFITGQLGLGGAEKQLYLLVHGLLLAGWRVSVITLNPGRGDYWEPSFRESGISFSGIPASLPRLQRLFLLRKVLRRGQAAIVHSWTIHANFYAAAGGRLSGTPVRLGSERANHHSSRQALGPWCYALSLWGLDGLVVNSEPAATFLRGFRPRLPVSVVPNAVVIPDAGKTKEQCRARLGIPIQACVVGAIGSLVPRKNFSALIAAVGSLVRGGIAPTLVIIGEGPLRRDLENQAALDLPKNQVFFTGAIPNAEELYPALDVVCMPSLDQEGMPNVLMEAAAAGLPVVATQVGGTPEVVEDGITGFLVSPDDIHTLADRLRKLLTDAGLRHRMGKEGKEKMQRQFSVERMVDRMNAVYQSALRHKDIV